MDHQEAVVAFWESEHGENKIIALPEVLALAQSNTEIVPFTVEEFLNEQATDPFCRKKAEAVGEKDSQFDYDRYGILVRKSNLDGALQRVVPVSLRARLLHTTHYPRLAGHPGGIRMYYSLRREYYWPHMANDVFMTVRDCVSCARNRATVQKFQKFMKLFPASGPLEFVAMDLLDPLRKTTRGFTFILVITDRFSKLTRCIPLRTTTAPVVAAAFLDYWVYAYGAPLYVLTDNGKQFTAKFFDAVCSMLGSRHFLTTAYHPQTDKRGREWRDKDKGKGQSLGRQGTKGRTKAMAG